MTYSMIDMISMRHKSGNLLIQNKKLKFINHNLNRIRNSQKEIKIEVKYRIINYLMLSSVYVFGISNKSGDILSRNSNF